MKVSVGSVEHDLRVEAAFSMPRLTFSDNFFCVMQSLLPLGIRPTKFVGAFWEQCLDRVLFEMLDRTDWILAIDYDSVFEADTVQRLMTAAMVSGYDAVAPLQTKRDEGVPMFTPEGHDGTIGLVQLRQHARHRTAGSHRTRRAQVYLAGPGSEACLAVTE